MPTQRLAFVLTVIIGLPTLLTFFALFHSHPNGKPTFEDESDYPQSGLRAFFSFHTPSSLFPRSAIISLTDDNSTFFLARPADFGPVLQPHGRSGQLWIGSGFGADGTGRNAEGELGCSDIPGWEDQKPISLSTDDKEGEKDAPSRAIDSKSPKALDPRTMENAPAQNDGTDDHLHHPLPSSPVFQTPASGTNNHAEPDGKAHADIQSLQETAEIAGKVALLSRGGCGFLEKVKWAQRRGAVAVIVGDHTRGGALVTMYARGDTSNITIASVFTSHTTAHLLSSLIPSEEDGQGPAVVKRQVSAKLLQRRKGSRSGKSSKKGKKPYKSDRYSSRKADSAMAAEKATTWSRLGRLFIIGKSSNSMHSESRRPPSSGRLDFSAERQKISNADDREHDSSTKTSTELQSQSTSPSKSSTNGNALVNTGDNFVIGVQDWRDPDLVVGQPGNTQNPSSSLQSTVATHTDTARAGKESHSKQQDETSFSGGSITPGSGEYANPDQSKKSNDQKKTENKDMRLSSAKGTKSSHGIKGQDAAEVHEGLWVTITPTTLSTSPFFDTLLVLVVSPLVTLTVVYALLLLRSRIRRRRWRAPKSIVDQLPIRTYHTMSASSSNSSTRLATPHSSSPTSPLLQSASRPASAGSRPRAATANGVGNAVSASLEKASTHASLAKADNITQTKRRRRYNSRQVECVVCLEEYVDGHSRVMSLPCGHEFHAECITPWLTTRRRTCPICKGDVVRSMTQPTANAGSASSSGVIYQEGRGSPDVQLQAAESRNDSPSAAIPIPREATDPERAEDMAATLVNEPDENGEPESSTSTSRSRWAELTSVSLGAFSGRAHGRKAHEERDS